jgi:hypothetical protein
MPAMTGYVAMTRVERGRIRTLAWDGPAALDGVVADEPVDAATLEPDDGISLAEELERLRDQLRMVTFYLTDPESWR